jgi:pilus assembly protein Flp/PilA
MQGNRYIEQLVAGAQNRGLFWSLFSSDASAKGDLTTQGESLVARPDRKPHGFWADEQGVTAIEYALLGALIAAFCALSITVVGTNVATLYATVSAAVTAAVSSAG